MPYAAPTAKPPKPTNRIAPLIVLYSDSISKVHPKKIRLERQGTFASIFCEGGGVFKCHLSSKGRQHLKRIKELLAYYPVRVCAEGLF